MIVAVVSIILLLTFFYAVGCVIATTIQVVLTDDWHYSIEAIHFMLLTYFAWKAFDVICRRVEKGG